MFIITLLGLFSSKLPFELVDSYINTGIGILANLGNDKNLAVFSPCDYLNAGFAAFTTGEDYEDLATEEDLEAHVFFPDEGAKDSEDD